MREVLHSHQGLLEAQLHHIFPSQNFVKNVRKDAEIKNPLTGGYMEVDVWFPELNLCFEYQDDYHYKSTWYSQIPIKSLEHRDNIKRNMLFERGQTLIVVPYWWNGKSPSLQESIHFQRPDLLDSSIEEQEIPSNPPSLALEGHKRLMLASFPDASMIDSVDFRSWWVGEKWDGIRCYWNVNDLQVYSRHNNKIDLLLSITNTFGHAVLDGELWSGRGFFQESQKFAVTTLERLNSALVRLICFDEASEHTHGQPFEARYALILSHIDSDNPVVIIAPRFGCTSEQDLLDTLENIISGGGEGLVMRKASSLYTPGTSNMLLKVKGSYSDQEALVVKVEEDGSLVLQLPNGSIFSVLKKDCMLHQQAHRGDIVTFSFDYEKRINLSQLALKSPTTAPANPVVQRIRTDLSWQNVLQNSSSLRWFGNEPHQFFSSASMQKNSKHLLEDSPPVNVKSQSWISEQDRRAYFDDFAASKGRDPLDPEFWYSTTAEEIQKHCKGYTSIANYYGGKYHKIVMHLYPNIGLQKLYFKVKEKTQKTKHELKQFFDNFATSKGKDPLVSSFWYTVTPHQLYKFDREFMHLSKYYEQSLYNILSQVYPDIGLNKSHFKVKFVHSWISEYDRKAYFDDFAKSKEQDPLDPEFWYSASVKEIQQYRKGYGGIAYYYGGVFHKIIMHLYPNIGLQQHRFTANNTSWKSVSDRKTFFDKFAKSKGEDPLNPDFWYTVSSQQLYKFDNGYKSIVKYTQGSLHNTLLQIYPDIGLNKALFSIKPTQSWISEESRKAYFDNFAISKGRDPLDPKFWYNVNVEDVQNYHKGYSGIAYYYGGKFYKIIMHLYPNIGLQAQHFKGQYWKLESNQKNYFDRFAKSKNKNPLDPTTWYTVTTRELLSYHHAYKRIASYNSGKLSTALLRLYPNIGLQESKFEGS